MTDESTNPQGSDNVEPSSDIDNPANLNFGEPEEQAEPQEEAEGNDPEPDDTPEGEEAEESETEAEPDEEQEETGEASKPEDPAEQTTPDEVLVTLQSGDQVQLDELKNGYMRDKDYRHKTTDLANSRRELEATAQRVNSTIEAFSQYLASQLPEKPSAALAYSDPAAYQQQNAIYDAAMEQVNTIIGMGQEGNAAQSEMTEAQMRSVLSDENAQLLSKMPALADAKKRDQFNTQTFQTAREFGFSNEELNKTTDHRLLMLGHYARIGLEAEQAKAKATMKIEKVPPVTPSNKRKVSETGQPNKKAMSRLRETGSIEDALKVDFE